MNTVTEEKELIIIDASQFGVEKSKAKQLESIFSGLAKKLNEFEMPFNEIIQEAEKEVTPDLAARAKRLRLDIGRAVRIPTEKARKEEKADVVRRGKAIDGLANIIKDASYDFENPLKKIEDHAEIMEQKRLEKLQSERVEILSKYVEDADERNLSGMEEDVWSAYLSAKKKEYEDRIEAERKAEQERIEAERKEKLRRDRERYLLPLEDFISKDLKDLSEYEEKEFSAIVKKAQDAKAEHEKEQEKIRKENERLKKEREAAAKKAESERKEREAYEAKLKKEREEREKIQAELKAKAEAERKEKDRIEAEKKEAEKREREAALAPEKDRLKEWVSKFELPDMNGKTGKESEKVMKEIQEKFNSFKAWAEKEINAIK